jgi:hypothetical protein
VEVAVSETPYEDQPPPPPPDDLHEARVAQVRDVTRPEKAVPRPQTYVFEFASPGADTAVRQVFPVTYDIVLDAPSDEPGSGAGDDPDGKPHDEPVADRPRRPLLGPDQDQDH